MHIYNKYMYIIIAYYKYMIQVTLICIVHEIHNLITTIYMILLNSLTYTKKHMLFPFIKIMMWNGIDNTKRTYHNHT